MASLDHARRMGTAASQAVIHIVRRLARGVLEVSHHTLVLVGLTAVALAMVVLSRGDLRQQAEVVALQWLQERHDEREVSAGNLLAGVAEPAAVQRATAADLAQLNRAQVKLTHWIARRYKVAQEPVAALVKEAWALGQRANLDPTLILAVIAVESSFNPFAQSPVGAQGLMQVMTRVHDEKFESFGGTRAAFDPLSNLRVGVQVLRDCIARAGSVPEGLRHYVGAASLDSDGGYAARVLSEQQFMRQVADGQAVPVTATHPPPTAAPTTGTPLQGPQPEATAPADTRPTPALPAIAAGADRPATTPERVALAR